MSHPPRVALFTDSYYEANGVARTANALEAYAAERNLPLLVVHAGRANQLIESGSVARLELRRSRWLSFGLEHDLRFDLALWRHAGRVRDMLHAFQPDVLHFTGPSDIGQLGVYLGHTMRIPMVGSWHTNLHEYASRRLLKHLGWASEDAQMRVRFWVERQSLSLTLLFYRIPRIVLAPNDEWTERIARRTGRPASSMTRGVDTTTFDPSLRDRTDEGVNIGYVGRLSPEKNVRMLAAVEAALLSAGLTNIRFTIVGDGKERAFLERTMSRATFTGTLRGDALAQAYADMDVFAFPSETETVGNVVLEAMASGVPIVAMDRGGHRFVVGGGGSTMVSTERAFVEAVRQLATDPARRAEMGRAARAAARTRSWDRVFDDVYQRYGAALAMGKSERPLETMEEPLAHLAGKQPVG